MTGAQEPRVRIEPGRLSTDGGDAGLLMRTYGSALDPWQQDVVDCWLGKDASGAYTVTSAGLAIPRQNGKNVCLEAREFYGLVMSGERILHTAHQVRTTKKSFRRLAQLFTDKRHPEIEAIVKNIRYTNGEEAIELDNGGSIEFMSRSRQAARGYDGISVVVFDEAQELTDDQLEAVMATLAASQTGTRQLYYAGTPPYPGCPGTVFRRRRSGCLTEAGAHDCWHEWSVEGQSLDEIDTEDRALWYATNPALGLHLTEEFTGEELRSMSKDGFARERLGWWSPVLTEAEDRPIDEEAWKACRSGKERVEGKTAFGVRFSSDGTEVVLAAAVIQPDGTARISLIERRSLSRGTRWLAEWLCQRYEKACCVVIDGRNGVELLIERICETWKAKNSLLRAGTKDVIAAASLLVNEVNEQTLSWYGPQDENLSDSALGAVRRPIGGGWGFGGDDPAPIEACALALWGVRTSKRDPQRKQRVGFG